MRKHHVWLASLSIGALAVAGGCSSSGGTDAGGPAADGGVVSGGDGSTAARDAALPAGQDASASTERPFQVNAALGISLHNHPFEGDKPVSGLALVTRKNAASS